MAGLLSVPLLRLVGLFDDFVTGVVFAAVLYLAWALIRERHRRRWLLLQLPGVAIFAAFSISAAAISEPGTSYVLAAGWVGHAAWDAIHHRADRAVPRWWSEWCIALDLLVALVLATTAP